jgi:hypothetical protein
MLLFFVGDNTNKGGNSSLPNDDEFGTGLVEKTNSEVHEEIERALYILSGLCVNFAPLR